MEGMGYEEIFKSLPADERKALLVKKDDFAAKAGIENSVRAVMSREICSCSFCYFWTKCPEVERKMYGINERCEQGNGTGD